MNPTNENGYPEGISCRVFMADDQAGEHAHRDIELIYNLEENVIVSVEEAAYRMGQDDILLVNAGKRHSVRCPAGSRKMPWCAASTSPSGFLASTQASTGCFSGAIR